MRKNYLSKRIHREDLDTFIELLSEAAEAIPPMTEPIPSVVRDPKDDYLLAHALMGEADYVVSGDKDLLTLEDVEGITFVTAGEFVDLLDV